MQNSRLITSEAVLRSLAALFLTLMVVACASRPVKVDPKNGYRPHLLAQKHANNDPSTFFVLSFSGGSFTALSYALYREKLFEEYEFRFLKRNVQGALAAMLFNPINWFKMIQNDERQLWAF
jgi:NTE family protein